jgi:hypothetical protein
MSWVSNLVPKTFGLFFVVGAPFPVVFLSTEEAVCNSFLFSEFFLSNSLV